MNERQKYDQAFLNAFNVDDDSLGPDLKFESIPEWDSIGHNGFNRRFRRLIEGQLHY